MVVVIFFGLMLFFGNSMLIWDVEMYVISYMNYNYFLLFVGLVKLIVLNWGVSGIDGVLSIVIGFGVGSNCWVCVVGDYCFFIDYLNICVLV